MPEQGAEVIDAIHQVTAFLQGTKQAEGHEAAPQLVQ